jgi:hypothetical protein
MRTPHRGEDPIFALIEHHRALSDRYDAAVNVPEDLYSADPILRDAVEEINR